MPWFAAVVFQAELAIAADNEKVSPGLVVWLEPQVPDDGALSKAEKKSNASKHFAYSSLAFPPAPITDTDDAAYRGLRKSLENAQTRWEEFEVELSIAQELDGSLEAIDIIRDERDIDLLIDVRSWQGAAVSRAFDATDFRDGAAAEPFRFIYLGHTDAYNRPWLAAIGLDADHLVGQGRAEPATWSDFQKFQTEAANLPDAQLDLSGLPAGVSVVVDGVPLANGTAGVPLRPGDHYLHVVVGGVISGRSKLVVEPEATVAVPVKVDREELAAAKAKLISGTIEDLPSDVQEALEKIAQYNGGPVYVAAMDGKRMRMLPFTSGAVLVQQRPVTVVVAAELGPMLRVSPIFDSEEAGKNVTAIGASGSASLEVGIYNAAILVGTDLAITPGKTISYGSDSDSNNDASSAFFTPWAGLGGYALRPTGNGPSLLVAGTFTWDAPAHFSGGGRVILGLPAGHKNEWVRLTLGATHSPSSRWDTTKKRPMTTMFLRVGFAGLL